MLLELKNLTAGYGGNTVLHGIALQLNDGETLALIGPNGAGKSTVLKAIFGLAEVTSGSIVFNGQPITGRPTHELLRQGLALVPQGRMVFGNLTVEENLRMGGYLVADRRAVTIQIDRIYADHPVLAEKRRVRASTLSGGNQQYLAIARALMVRPKVLLLDEPSLGLAPKVIAEVFAALQRLRDDGLSMIIVEQNVRYALQAADRCCVLVSGRLRFDGSPAALHNPERLRELFLG